MVLNRRGVLRSATLAAAFLLGGTSLAASSAAQASPARPAAERAACGTLFPEYAPAPVASAETVLKDEAITMSDGTVLRADVHLPAGLDGPLPTALTITGYNKSAAGSMLGMGGGQLWQHGYANVIVDDRGTGSSGGQWGSWDERTLADYPEVLDWIVAQPWSNGDVALVGGSYMGITSLFAAASGHPAVKAVFATVPMGDAYRDIVMGGGEVNAAFIPLWMGLVTGLGLIPSTDPATIIEHIGALGSFQIPSVAGAVAGGGPAFDGPFWRQRSPIEVADHIEVPTFIVGGLDDLFQRGEPMLYEALADHADARLLIGPWNHLTTGQGLPADGVPTVDALTLQWLDAHVRGLPTGAECIPPATQYIRGAEHYESAASWPVPGLHAERWHLRGDGTLTAGQPIAAEAGRQYLQLPITGICTRSAGQWLIGLLDGTSCPTDNRLDEALSLTYTTEPFTESVRINGPIEADLWLETLIGSDALTSVAISSVAPDGTSRGLTNGLQLASQRAVDAGRARLLDGQSIQPWHPFTEAAVQPVTPGEAVLVPVEVFPTSAEIPAGHRLRVTVAAYDVPHALPPVPAALATLGGPVTVLNDAAHPSSVVIPVVGARSVTAPVAGAPTPGGLTTAGPTAEQSPGANTASLGAAQGARSTGDTLPATGGATALGLGAVLLAAGLLLRPPRKQRL